MAVYHCPVCPLIFQFRTEVEWHLREQHRSRTDEEADLRAEVNAAWRRLDWLTLRALRAANTGPAVSLLLATSPAPAMSVLDVARLRQLADRARRRLPAEPDHGPGLRVLEHRLARVVAAAEGRPTGRGLAMFVGYHDMAVIELPFGPRDRAVIDRTFATRDLEYALRRYPSYRVLVLGPHPRVFEGRGPEMTEVPVVRRSSKRAPTGFARPERVQLEVDRVLEQCVVDRGDLPLIIIGGRRRLAAFHRGSRHASDVVARVRRDWTRTATIDTLAQQALAGWHAGEQTVSVAELNAARAAKRVAWGLTATWQAVQGRGAERIWVESDFARRGRVAAGPEGIDTSSHADEPGVVDDVVDALLAKAALLGIPVDILDPGALAHPEPIAAQLAPDGGSVHSDPRALVTA
jgi:hypothetical protein